MAPISTPQSARAQLGVATRFNASPEVLTAARRNLAEANIAKRITLELEKAPPLTSEQADRLAALLRGADA
ncbi:hypothetical protein M2317_002205 [Microbacterium sp. ZKA21]|uniref:hypothetical protein n=1 Tax=Microbacterium sp. ZKA21 TaxID=3381694 RepID=UPI003D21900B